MIKIICGWCDKEAIFIPEDIHRDLLAGEYDESPVCDSCLSNPVSLKCD